jgi:hypothetical protein
MPKNRSIISRRQVLKIGGGVTLLPLASVLGLVGPSQAGTGALRLKSFDAKQAGLLLSMSRTLFPHDFLGDEHYMKVVAELDTDASTDNDVARMLKAALAAFPNDFSARQEEKREDYLRTLETSPFFRLVYQETIAGLYGDSEVSALLGYEGSSVEHGGYIDRGFDDIAWLPRQGSVAK